MKMKMKGFQLAHFLVSSPNYYESGQFHSFSKNPLRFIPVFRYFSSKSASNKAPHVKIKSQVLNVKGVGDALNLFEKMTQKKPFSSEGQFSQLLSHAVKLKEYPLVITLFKNISDLGIRIDACAMNIAIDSYCLSNRVDYGFSILALFFKRGCVPNAITFGTLLKGFFLENRILEAQEFFEKIEREGLCELNTVAYGTVIDGLCKAGEISAAVEMLKVMEKGKCRPSIDIYNMVINGYCKNKKIDDAMRLFREIPRKGLKPDVATYNSLLQGLFCGGRCSTALEIFDELKAAGGLKPDFYTYCNMLDGLCRNGQVERALSFLVELEGKGVNLHITYYTIVMRGLYKAKKLDMARAIFNDLPSKGWKPDRVAYNMIITGCCQEGLLEEANGYLLEMKGKGCLPDSVTYNVILRGYLVKGEFDEAAKFLEEMDRRGFSAKSSLSALLLNLVGKREQNPTKL